MSGAEINTGKFGPESYKRSMTKGDGGINFRMATISGASGSSVTSSFASPNPSALDKDFFGLNEMTEIELDQDASSKAIPTNM